MNISPLAVVDPGATIGENVQIDPFAVIEKDVVIGDNCHIFPHAVILNGARIGNNCRIFPGAVIAGIPQDLKFKGEITTAEIGNNNLQARHDSGRITYRKRYSSLYTDRT